MPVDQWIAPEEERRARARGRARQAENLRLKRCDAHGLDPMLGVVMHELGAIGEYGVAKWLGVPWTGERVFRAADVGRLEVRCAAKHTHRLLVRSTDNPDSRYVHTTYNGGLLKIWGWMWARDAMKDCYLDQPDRSRPPCWAVPACDVMPPETLLEGAAVKDTLPEWWSEL